MKSCARMVKPLSWFLILLTLCLTTPIQTEAQSQSNQCGTKIAFTRYDGRTNIFLLDLDTGDITQLTQAVEDVYLKAENPSWDPTGERIVFSGQVNTETDTAAVSEDLFIINADGTNLIRLTNTTEDELSPKWSADGYQIAYLSDDGGDWDIYSIDLNDMAITNLTNHEGNDGIGGFAWSPDGAQIVFASDRNQGQSRQGRLILEQVFVIDVARASNGEAALLDLSATFDNHNNFYHDLAWSPDGDWIAFSNNAGEIFVVEVEEQSDRSLLQSDSFDSYFGLSWSPDSDRLVFVSHPDGSSESGRYGTELFVVDVRDALQDDARPTQITDFDTSEAAVYSPAWQPCPLNSDDIGATNHD